MREFFYGWRRKVGCLTLIVACAFALGWVRSTITRDMFNFQLDPRTIYYVISNRSRIVLRQFRTEYPSTSVIGFHQASRAAKEDFFNEAEFVVEWHWQAAGFEFGKTYYRTFTPKMRNQYWSIPYWAIVIPLTLLSVYLLLVRSPPRKKSIPA